MMVQEISFLIFLIHINLETKVLILEFLVMLLKQVLEIDYIINLMKNQHQKLESTTSI